MSVKLTPEMTLGAPVDRGPNWLEATGVDLAATPAAPIMTLRGPGWELTVEGEPVSDDDAFQALREVAEVVRRLRREEE